MQYELVRSKRRTLAITIDGSGRCIVRAPLRMPLGEIHNFIEEKQHWINAKQREMRLKAELAPAEPLLAEGAVWRIAGNELQIKINGNAAKNFIGIDGSYIVCGSGVSQKNFLIFIRKTALQILQSRTKHFAVLTGTVPCGIKLSSAYARWGSCSGKNVLNFSWRLIFAPPALIDYVVVHELCHIGCMNHSLAFWRRVAAVMPDYEIRRKALKQYGYVLKWFR